MLRRNQCTDHVRIVHMSFGRLIWGRSRSPIAGSRTITHGQPMPNFTQAPLENLTIDPTERPNMPPLSGATDEHRRQGRKLAAIHRGHLWEIARISKVLDRIEAGDEPPASLKDIVLASDMAQNFRAFGSLCGQECRMLTFHHDAEEHMMFPKLESAGQDALTKLVARLRYEHKIVHELLVRLERAAMTLMYEPNDENFALARSVFTRLVEVVTSHFGYEETELEEAIGLYIDDL